MTSPVMRAVIVCGPRDGTGQLVVARALDTLGAEQLARRIPRFEYLVVGSWRGTDREAWYWALEREIPVLVCSAKWNTGKRGGPAEGPIRNSFMLEWVKPVAVLGFSGGPGTADMMSKACGGRVPSYWWSPHDDLWVRDERSEEK